jgi:hypothetical protein
VSDVFSAVPSALDAFTAANQPEAATTSAAGFGQQPPAERRLDAECRSSQLRGPQPVAPHRERMAMSSNADQEIQREIDKLHNQFEDANTEQFYAQQHLDAVTSRKNEMTAKIADPQNSLPELHNAELNAGQ